MTSMIQEIPHTVVSFYEVIKKCTLKKPQYNLTMQTRPYYMFVMGKTKTAFLDARVKVVNKYTHADYRLSRGA